MQRSSKAPPRPSADAKPPVHLAPIVERMRYDEEKVGSSAGLGGVIVPVMQTEGPSVTDLIRQAREDQKVRHRPVTPNRQQRMGRNANSVAPPPIVTSAPSNRADPSSVPGIYSPLLSNGDASGRMAVPAEDGDSTITVAVRIRPFNQKEVSELKAEQQRRQQTTTLSASARLSNTVNRLRERQPFGPGHEENNNASVSNANSNMNATLLTVGATGEVVANPLQNCDMDLLLDDMGEPLPVMDVRGRGRLVLLNPNGGDRGGTEFSFDHIFSSFAPSVEMEDLLKGDELGMPPHLGDTFTMDRHQQQLAGAGVGSPTQSSSSPLPATCSEEVALSPEQHQRAEAEQLSIFHCLGMPLVESALAGFNACLFAYGQTSSGKTYTMMGTKAHRGVTPRLCRELFSRVEQQMKSSAGGYSVDITVSYMEIYNEQVRDLLKKRPKNAILHYNSRFDTRDVDYQEYQTLKVRTSPQNGVFVDGLTSVKVSSWEECAKYMRQGDALRTQCSTTMNANSSRSHAIFQLVLDQVTNTGGRVRGRAVSTRLCSKVSLVDLAGSERNSKTESTGKHLVEANSINTSLSTLRRVMDGIVSKQKVIPKRESLLTYVLSDNFGGNSKTVMCANVSPHAVNHAETESTLRYATLAREIKNRVKLNENPSTRLIKELKDRVKTLQEAAQQPTEEIYKLQEQVMEMTQREADLHHALQMHQQREEELQRTVLVHQRSEERWHQEAERQKKQKEQLRSAFRLLASSTSPVVQQALEEVGLRGGKRGTNMSESIEGEGASSGRGRRSPEAYPASSSSAVGAGHSHSHPQHHPHQQSPPPQSASTPSKHVQALRSLQKYNGMGVPLSLAGVREEQQRVWGGAGESISPFSKGSSKRSPQQQRQRRHSSSCFQTEEFLGGAAQDEQQHSARRGSVTGERTIESSSSYEQRRSSGGSRKGQQRTSSSTARDRRSSFGRRVAECRN